MQQGLSSSAVALVNHKGVSFNILIINFIWLRKFDNKFVQMEFYKAFIIKFQQLNKATLWRMPFDGSWGSEGECKWEVVQVMIYWITMTMSEFKLVAVWAVDNYFDQMSLVSCPVFLFNPFPIDDDETENQIPLWLPSSWKAGDAFKAKRHQISLPPLSSKLSPFPENWNADPWLICVKPR